MPAFAYKARTASGSLDSGVLQADNLDAATAMLRTAGKFVIELSPQGKNGKAGRPAKPAAKLSAGAPAKARSTTGKRKKIKRAEVITFAHQLAVMIDTGVPLGDALDCIGEQTDNLNMADVIAAVTQTVQSGNELSVALEEHPKVFPPIMASLVKASEASGTLGTMLDRVSQYLGKEQATAKKIKSALTYPAVMLGLVVVITLGLMIFVLPRFETIYAGKGAALPAPTRMLLATSGQITGFWYAYAGGAAALIVGLAVFLRTPTGRNTLDQAKLSTPVVGPLFERLYLTRACRTLGTMIDAGVPILDMVAIVRDVTNNVQYDALWDEVDQQLRAGDPLSAGLKDSPLIPGSVSQMIVSGEKSGRLGSVMSKVADYTEAEFDDRVKAATQLIEPAMIVTMGAIIGFVAIALLLPIFSVGSAVSG
ncbi:MAG: type II secretion system F family protein [Planctomycetota bacterium]